MQISMLLFLATINAKTHSIVQTLPPPFIGGEDEIFQKWL